MLLRISSSTIISINDVTHLFFIPLIPHWFDCAGLRYFNQIHPPLSNLRISSCSLFLFNFSKMLSASWGFAFGHFSLTLEVLHFQDNSARFLSLVIGFWLFLLIILSWRHFFLLFYSRNPFSCNLSWNLYIGELFQESHPVLFYKCSSICGYLSFNCFE